ncbi:MAG: ABC transporter permease [Candidatus Binatus sp.]|uniref:ABC transporter permease n=2 Tax=Candidatus Binatus sp. TaxID=2811406 RepID=UPI003BB1E621
MMIAKLFIVAIRNMRRQLRRTILTALSFAVAVFLFTVLVAVPVSMDRIAADAAKGLRLIVIPHNSYKLPAKYCNDIRKMPHVMGCAPELQWGAIYRDPRNQIMAIGVTQDIYSVSGPSDFQLPPEIRKQMFTDRRNASVGSVLMREQGLKLGQPFTLRSPENAKLTLTLIPKTEMPTLLTARALFFDRRLLDEAVKNAYGADIQDRATFLAVRVDRAENMNSVIGEIDENFHNSDGETETTPESDALNSVITGIGDVRTIMYSICIVVLLTVLLIAANSMAMMVRDRITEVAVMRALGFARVHVVALLLTEAALIGLAGAIVGAGAALWCFHGGISLGALTGGLGYMAVAPSTAALAVLVALGVSLLSAVAPVTQAANIPPAMAFRKVV